MRSTLEQMPESSAEIFPKLVADDKRIPLSKNITHHCPDAAPPWLETEFDEAFADS